MTIREWLSRLSVWLYGLCCLALVAALVGALTCNRHVETPLERQVRIGDEEAQRQERQARQNAKKARELEERERESRRAALEKECADQGLKFVGTVGGKVECRP
jgi:hypothetical protein